jgi:hypothetical protein
MTRSAGRTHINDNTLVVFDNGNTRRLTDPTADSRGQEWVLNEQTMTATPVVNADLGNYSAALGSAQVLPNGNLAFTSGFQGSFPAVIGQSIEVSPGGTADYVLQMNSLEYRSYFMNTLYETVTSSVSPLPAVTTTARFTVSWSGCAGAGGSGIASYSIYVSVDGGAFLPWLTNTALTSASYAGSSGHHYGFYSVATDTAGNCQPTPTAAQSSTRVVIPLTFTLPPALPPAKVGVAYRRGITVSGGIGPDRFSIASGSLPPGVTLSASTGLLSGTPTRPGAYDFTVRVADSSLAPGASASQGFTLTVAQGDVARLLFLSQPGNAPLNRLLLPFQVLVLDQFGNRLSGVVVRLALVPIATIGPAAFSPGSVVQATAVNGVATFSRVALGARGRYLLLAVVGSVGVLSDPFDVAVISRSD